MSRNGKRNRIDISEEFDVTHMKSIMTSQTERQANTQRKPRAIIADMSAEIIHLRDELGWSWGKIADLLKGNGFNAAPSTIRQYSGRAKRDSASHSAGKSRKSKSTIKENSKTTTLSSSQSLDIATPTPNKETRSPRSTSTTLDDLFETKPQRARYQPPTDDAASKYD